MPKKILLVCASIFLLYQSVKLSNAIFHVEIESWWVNILLGAVFNLLITGVFALSGFALPTQKLLPEGYYKIRNSKSLKRWHRFFNVDLFRKFLLATFWKKKEDQKKFFDGTKSGIGNLITQSKKSEFGHLLPFITITILAGYLLSIGKWKLTIPLMIINIFFNFYPILLQRHHRMRIQLIEARQQRKK